MDKLHKIKLNNGYEMPIVGLGTYNSNEGEQAVKDAIDAGYRHFDTAYFYGNEVAVGKAIKSKLTEGIITRDDVFVVTKLWNTYHDVTMVEYACRMSLENLDMDYVDLYLIHSPVGFTYRSDDVLLPKLENGAFDVSDVDYLETWLGMEKIVRLGLARSIGISNFNSEQITRLLSVAEIKPAVNQVECHPNLNQRKLINFCMDRNIVVTAYCPLGRPKPENKTPEFLYDSRVLEIGKKYGKTSAQVVLRYLIEIGTIIIPKSCNKQRIEENINLFDFALSKEDIDVIDTFNNNKRIVKFLDAENHKYFPFSIEF